MSSYIISIMKKALKSLMLNVKGAISITDVVVDVALVTALIPVIKTFIGSAQNLTASETVLLGLATLFIVLALIFSIVKQSGLSGKGKK